jgi:hypothetical protein
MFLCALTTIHHKSVSSSQGETSFVIYFFFFFFVVLGFELKAYTLRHSTSTFL